MNNKKLPSMIVLMILTVITTLFWVSFNIYRVFTANPALVVPKEIILPIDPKLDTDTITSMKNKNYPISDDIVQLATTEPIATALPEITPVATIIPTVTETPVP